MSMRQHHVLFKEVGMILTHRLIRLGKNFRYAILRNGIDLHWFYPIATLQRLCQNLIDCTKHLKRGSDLPLVVAVWMGARDTYLVTAINSSKRHGHGDYSRK